MRLVAFLVSMFVFTGIARADSIDHDDVSPKIHHSKHLHLKVQKAEKQDKIQPSDDSQSSRSSLSSDSSGLKNAFSTPSRDVDENDVNPPAPSTVPEH